MEIGHGRSLQKLSLRFFQVGFCSVILLVDAVEAVSDGDAVSIGQGHLKLSKEKCSLNLEQHPGPIADFQGKIQKGFVDFEDFLKLHDMKQHYVVDD